MPAAWVTAAASVGGLLMNSGGGSATGTSNAAADDAAKVGREQWEYYKQNYQPLESNLIKQASDAGSPEEFARNRGKANADVTGAFDTARKNTLSRLQSYGINPGSPAYQSAAASTDIAEGATKAGALTAADTNTRNLAYSKALDVAGLGRNIPAQSAASSASAANAATGASRNQFLQQTQNAQNVGYGINSIGNAARKWFGQPSSANYNSNGTIANPTSYGDTYSMADPAYGAKGGKVSAHGIGDDEGAVIDAEKTGDGEYDATALKGVLQKRGLNPSVAHRAAHGAATRHSAAITPHMRHFASGGGVGRQGLESAGPDASNMGELQGPGTGTSDSIPASIDGQQPAALSTGEVVMNAEVPKLTGDEILEALNDAGLRKRDAGLQPQNEAPPVPPAPPNAATQAFRSGGRVSRFAHAGMGG